ITTMEDLRLEGRARRLGAVATAVIVDGKNGKEYRTPTPHEVASAIISQDAVQKVYNDIPFGITSEDTPLPAGSKFNSSSLRIYGFDAWHSIFTHRQQLAMAELIRATRSIVAAFQHGEEDWSEAIVSLVACLIGKIADYSSTLCTWHITREVISHVFTRYALP